ncbi:tetratricopeptide repeat protein [Oleispirillum naphthae]|uniref:tetratricopeptide repeat protein n=1 Tax=Oleispirillum naphthae TaxID=2838853 RepID=UPI00308248AA
MSPKSPELYKQAEEKRRLEQEAAAQNSLFREVDDDLRHDRMLSLWKRYGLWMIGAAVAVVLAVAGYQVHKYMQESERAEQAAAFDAAEAALAASDPAKAIGLLSGLETKGNAGYRTLARLQHAALLLDQGKHEEARALIRAVGKDAGTLPAYRDLAVVQDALAGMDGDDPKALEAALAPLTAAGHPWRHVALQLSALAMARGGEPGRAADALKEILDDPDTPPDQRAMTEALRTVFARDAAAKQGG